MKRNKTEWNALLYDMQSGADAQSLNRWVGSVMENFRSSFENTDYHAVFRGSDIDGEDTLIAACGRMCGFTVSVSRSGVEAKLDLPGGIVKTFFEPAKTKYDTVPFTEVFAMLDRMHAELKAVIPPEFGCVPIVGGIECVFLSDELKRIADYYVPELALFGTAPDFRLFRAAHIPKVPMPEDAVMEIYTPGCPVREEEHYPDRAEYLEKMETILGMLKDDELKKIVVSHMDEIVPAEFDLNDFTAYLLDRYFQEYFYCFVHGDGTVWAGISPGVIMKQHGRRAMTRPLAGTRKKTGDPAEDARLREDLVSAEKDIIEHEHALYHMRDRLVSADIGPVEILKNKAVLETPYTLHLMSELSVDLKPEAETFDVIGALYPPATVWGIPVDKTEHVLPVIENFHRGFFTGVFGYWTADGDANTALIIRSCSIAEGKVRIYAGGGIVKGSVPEDEFEESVGKMGPIRNYFGA